MWSNRGQALKREGFLGTGGTALVDWAGNSEVGLESGKVFFGGSDASGDMMAIHRTPLAPCVKTPYARNVRHRAAPRAGHQSPLANPSTAACLAFGYKSGLSAPSPARPR